MKKHTRAPKRIASASLAARDQLPLGNFKAVDIPDFTPLKFVYSDYRTVVASLANGEYIYRANSLFDPDVTGVGGQPDGFDQWKTLYDNYRVVAVEVEVQASYNAASGCALVTFAPSLSSTAFSSSEEIAGLRHAQTGVCTASTPVKLRKLLRISEIVGVTDLTVLTDANYNATSTTNPGQGAYIHVGTETSATSGEVFIWTKLTYYTRLEQPIATLDTLSRHSRAFRLQRALKPAHESITQTATSDGTMESNSLRASPAVIVPQLPALSSAALGNGTVCLGQIAPPCMCAHHTRASATL